MSKHCNVCGAEQDDNAKFCKVCGAAAEGDNGRQAYDDSPVPPPRPDPEKTVNKKAVIIAAAVSLVLVVLIILLVVLCFGKKDKEKKPSDNENTGYSDNSETTTAGGINGALFADETTAAPETTAAAYFFEEEDADPLIVLEKYTAVMNKLKANVKKYDKKEYQTMSDDCDFGTLGNAVIGIANGIMTSEGDAVTQHLTDSRLLPVMNNGKGCLLTDVNAIKSASMNTVNGKTTIVIVLIDEVSPLPAENNATSCSSAVGSMFTPISRERTDDIIAKFSGIMTIKDFTVTGWNCTATLVFDEATERVESLHQTMNYRIDIRAKVAIMDLDGYANVKNDLHIDNIIYA